MLIGGVNANTDWFDTLRQELHLPATVGSGISEIVNMTAEIMNSLENEESLNEVLKMIGHHLPQIMNDTGLEAYVGEALGGVAVEDMLKMLENLTSTEDLESMYEIMMQQVSQMLNQMGLQSYLPLNVTEIPFTDVMNMYGMVMGNMTNMEEM